MRIPEHGWTEDASSPRWNAPRATTCRGATGAPGPTSTIRAREAEEVIKQAYAMYLSENAPRPDRLPERAAPGERGRRDGGRAPRRRRRRRRQLHQRRHREHHPGGQDGARPRARRRGPRSRAPEMVLPVTAHAAFQKAGHYLGVKPVLVPVDPTTFRADVDAVRARDHAEHDPARRLGRLLRARRRRSDPRARRSSRWSSDLLLHVDGCMGGFLLPYFRRLGAPVPAFDFGVPGVTSISMDLHKYAFAAKGASAILYRSKELRRHQIYACAQLDRLHDRQPDGAEHQVRRAAGRRLGRAELHRRRRLPRARAPGARRDAAHRRRHRRDRRTCACSAGRR